jgi:hypothetical protein
MIVFILAPVQGESLPRELLTTDIHLNELGLHLYYLNNLGIPNQETDIKIQSRLFRPMDARQKQMENLSERDS